VWAAAPDGVNTAFQYTFTNTISFSSNVILVSGNGTNQLLLGTINATSIGVLANSTVLTVGNSSVNTTVNATSFSGTANNANNLGGTSLTTLQTQITGNAATAYTNATTYSANASNLGNGTVAPARLASGTANSSTILYGNGVWASASGVSLVKQQFTGDGANTQFAVTGGYTAGAMTVYVNGVKQLETTDVITTSGANIAFVTAPGSNYKIDAFGFGSVPSVTSNTSVVSQQFTANGTGNTFAVSGGYTVGTLQVFVNGVKYVESSDVVTTSGANINFTTPPTSGSIIDVFGQVSFPPLTPSYLPIIGGTLSGTVNVGSNVSITTTGIYINNFNTIAANYLLLPTDYIVQANNSLTLTLMAASTVTGKQFYIRNINTSDVNIVGNTSSETINGYANIVMQFKNSSLGLISTGSSWIIN